MIKMDKNAKNNFLVVGIFALGIVILMGAVFAVAFVATIDVPIANGNYSGSVEFNVTTGLTSVGESYNVSIYYNVSEGNASSDLLGLIINETAAQTVMNRTFDTTSLADGSSYTFGVYADNGTDQNWSLMVYNVTIDNTPPAVSTFYNTIDGGSYKDSIVVNVSVTDAAIGIDSVYFNITNSAGTQVNFTKASNEGGYYNITVNTSVFTEGIYNITVFANDTLWNHLNSSETISVTFDNTNPAIVLTSSSATRNILVLTATITDATTASGSCTIDREGASVTSGSGTNVQTITESGLVCNSAYSYIVTCTDAAGNSAASASTSFTTSVCASASVSSSSSSTTTWTMSYSPSEEQATEGYSRELKAKERVKVDIYSDGLSEGTKSTHSVGVKSISGDKVTIEIASDPIELELSVGEDADVDVNEDGYYDLYVRLDGIENNKADIFVQKVYTEIPEGEGAVETTGEIVTAEEDEVVEDEKDAPWMIIIIVLVILAAAIGGGVAWNKR
jgi:hypothetical protein